MREHLDPTRRGFSVDDVSRAYGLSRQRIYDELNNGRLPSMTVGRRRVITFNHLDEWERRCAADPSESQRSEVA
jgi:excisionase family DNA binding protein